MTKSLQQGPEQFICAIPRVHGGYFNSSSCIFQRVHQEGWQQFLSERRILQDITLVAEDACRKLERKFSEESYRIQVCRDRPWITA